MKLFLPLSSHRSLFIAILAVAIAISGAVAQPPPAPPKPAVYRVQLRYRIFANRNERIVQYLALRAHQNAIGFQKDPGPEGEAEDWRATRMSGTIASANAIKLLDDAHVKSLILIPAQLALPDNPNTLVKVSITLASGWPLDRQRALADQVREILQELGFREAVGYDNRRFTRLLGALPASDLDTLLTDLRYQPSRWLVPEKPLSALPMPLRDTSPVLMTEVLAVAPDVKEFPEPPSPAAGKEPLLKTSADLRALAGSPAEAASATRLEIILAFTPDRDDRSWLRALRQTAPGLVLEGLLGQVATVVARPDQAAALAELPLVSTVRLPRAARPRILPAAAGATNTEALRASGLDRLHARGYRGRGVRVAVVDSDFRGWEQARGHTLPARTQYLDVTAERSRDVLPDPFANDGSTPGHGTLCAQTVALAAPEADLTLVRMDAAAPYQLLAIARAISGDTVTSEGITQREDELLEAFDRLNQRREELAQERRIVLDAFGQDPASRKRRDAFLQRQAQFEQEVRDHEARQRRLLKLIHDLEALKGTHVVSCALVWESGYPMGGGSALSRYFDDRPFCAALWFQAAGDTGGQGWAGPFRDNDGNGVMEFAPPGIPLRPERWTSELNFLAWQPVAGPRALDLPAGARVRVSIQWREAHDPELWRLGDDLYREPLASPLLMMLRQLDPSGNRVATDEMEVVARSGGLPQRLDNQPQSATYEQTLEFQVESPGRYALRVEGRQPEGFRPASAPTLPIQQKTWELRPRILVEVLDRPSWQQGRLVFLDYPAGGGIGMPGDAHAVITTGAADGLGHPERYSADGPAPNLDLLGKPDVLEFDELASGSGTSLATSFAAGLSASALSSGLPCGSLLKPSGAQPGRVLRIP